MRDGADLQFDFDSHHTGDIDQRTTNQFSAFNFSNFDGIENVQLRQPQTSEQILSNNVNLVEEYEKEIARL